MNDEIAMKTKIGYFLKNLIWNGFTITLLVLFCFANLFTSVPFILGLVWNLATWTLTTDLSTIITHGFIIEGSIVGVLMIAFLVRETWKKAVFQAEHEGMTEAQWLWHLHMIELKAQYGDKMPHLFEGHQEE